MTEPSDRATPSARARRFVLRGASVLGFAVGAWLLASAWSTASAQPPTPPSPAPPAASGGLLGSLTHAAVDTGSRVVAAVTEAPSRAITKALDTADPPKVRPDSPKHATDPSTPASHSPKAAPSSTTKSGHALPKRAVTAAIEPVAHHVAAATAPATDPAASAVAKAAEPVARTVSNTLAPVVAPVSERVRQVTEAAKPVTDAIAPVADAVAPVADALAPVTGALAPVTDAAGPVAGIAAPPLSMLPILEPLPAGVVAELSAVPVKALGMDPAADVIPDSLPSTDVATDTSPDAAHASGPDFSASESPAAPPDVTSPRTASPPGAPACSVGQPGAAAVTHQPAAPGAPIAPTGPPGGPVDAAPAPGSASGGGAGGGGGGVAALSGDARTAADLLIFLPTRAAPAAPPGCCIDPGFSPD